MGFPGGSMVKNPPSTAEMWVRSLGQENPMQMANGNPLQYYCLKNPMDRGAWTDIVHAVTKSQTTIVVDRYCDDPQAKHLKMLSKI